MVIAAVITTAPLASPSATHETRRIGRRFAAIHVNIARRRNAMTAPMEAASGRRCDDRANGAAMLIRLQWVGLYIDPPDPA